MLKTFSPIFSSLFFFLLRYSKMDNDLLDELDVLDVLDVLGGQDALPAHNYEERVFRPRLLGSDDLREQEFFKHFRFTKEMVAMLCGMIRDQLERVTQRNGALTVEQVSTLLALQSFSLLVSTSCDVVLRYRRPPAYDRRRRRSEPEHGFPAC
jgi:uncharacterized protein YcbK (DUF882 family)